METDVKKAALILATGMVLSACILLFAIHLGTSRMSRAVSHIGVPNLSSPLKVQVEQTPHLLDREKLTQALIKALTSAKTRDGRSISNVVVTSASAPGGTEQPQFSGTLSCDNPDEQFVFSADFRPDGFEGYRGIVNIGPKDGKGQSQQIPGLFYIK